VDVGVRNAGNRLDDFERIDIELADLGEYLEGCRVLDLAVLRATGSRDRRLDGRPQLLLRDRLLEARADHFRKRFVADLRTEPLLDHAHRNLAGPEPFQARTAPHLLDARADGVLEALGGESNRELAAEGADVFDRDLHAVPL